MFRRYITRIINKNDMLSIFTLHNNENLITYIYVRKIYVFLVRRSLAHSMCILYVWSYVCCRYPTVISIKRNAEKLASSSSNNNIAYWARAWAETVFLQKYFNLHRITACDKIYFFPLAVFFCHTQTQKNSLLIAIFCTLMTAFR